MKNQGLKSQAVSSRFPKQKVEAVRSLCSFYSKQYSSKGLKLKRRGLTADILNHLLFTPWRYLMGILCEENETKAQELMSALEFKSPGFYSFNIPWWEPELSSLWGLQWLNRSHREFWTKVMQWNGENWRLVVANVLEHIVHIVYKRGFQVGFHNEQKKWERILVIIASGRW